MITLLDLYKQDLKLLISVENDTLKWKELRDGMALKEQIQVMRDGMMRMVHTEIGFAMPFFIGFEKLKLPAIESLLESKGLAVKIKNTPKEKWHEVLLWKNEKQLA